MTKSQFIKVVQKNFGVLVHLRYIRSKRAHLHRLILWDSAGLIAKYTTRRGAPMQTSCWAKGDPIANTQALADRMFSYDLRARKITKVTTILGKPLWKERK